ncbi:MAG TPA: hypothetical protein VGV59_21615 [Pyrinomonadaceae bacterium]|nr:hypothetical protein [Pyrinomonadaceae bacterium]
MSTPMYEYEFEFEGEGEYEGEYEGEFEFESELEGEYEGEFEGEMEAEEFFGRLAGLARRAAQSPALRSIGLQAARAALGGLSRTGGVGGLAANVIGGMLPQQEFEGEFEGELEFEGEGEYEGEYEDEFEFEGEFEGEFEAFSNPQSRLQTEALMAHLGNAAASAESEEEAEAFLGALVPLAAQLIPRVAPIVMRAAPQLINGVASAARTLMNSPTTQQLVRTLPTIAKNTVGAIARQVADGRPVTVQSAVQTLARQTANVIGNPQQATRAYQRNKSLDRAHHRNAPRPTAPINRPKAQSQAQQRRPQPRPAGGGARVGGARGGAVAGATAGARGARNRCANCR